MTISANPRNAVLRHLLPEIEPGRVLLLNADPESCQILTDGGFDLMAISPYRDICLAADCEPEVPEEYEPTSVVIVRGTRQREETLGLIATAFAHVAPEGHVIVVQSNALGAEGLGKTLRKASNAPVDATSKHHARAFYMQAGMLSDDVIADWKKQAEPKPIKGTPYKGQAGLFGFDKLDIGTKTLLDTLPEDISGVVGDFGCGPGLLSMRLLAMPNIAELHAVDVDWRAVQVCWQNGLHDERLNTYWADARAPIEEFPDLDFCVLNPPFHDSDGEDKELGRAMVDTAKHHLKKGGTLYVVANSHLRYEQQLHRAEIIRDENGFKVLKWVKH